MSRSDPKFVRAAKNSPWILIALGLHLILATVLSVVVIRNERRKASTSATSIAVAPSRPAPAAPAVEEHLPERRPIPELEPLELASFEEADAFVPTEEPQEIDLHADIGDPTGAEGDTAPATGGAWIGVGIGGHRGTGVPSGIVGIRPGNGGGHGKEGRWTRHQPVGTEEAVLEGLRWLMRHQEADGSWSAAKLHEH